MMWELMLKEFERHKLRTLLTMLGVTIGIFLVTSVSSFSEGIIYYVNERISLTSGLVTVVDSETPEFMIHESEIDQDLVEEVRTIPGVERIAEILYADVEGVGTVVGYSPESGDIIKGVNIEIEEGREAEEERREIELGRKYADEYDYVIGDTIKMEGVEFEVVGIIEETGREEIDYSLMMPLKDLQELVGKEGKITLMMIQPSTPGDAESIEQAINDDFDEIKAATDKSIMNSVNKMLSQLNIMTFALGSIAALISGIVIMNVMIISVRERRREIGTMKAVGATNKQILSSILLEAIMISIIGAIIGLILSFGGAAYLNTILLKPIALITPRLVIQSLVFAVFIGVVSGILPARQAARLNPIEALRYE